MERYFFVMADSCFFAASVAVPSVSVRSVQEASYWCPFSDGKSKSADGDDDVGDGWWS